ncbi:CHAT domain-containing protein, partial [Anabaena sp. CCY 0017]|uniref:CHAT domain-containing protein n=1 Tax=Anabaena sp. CCY 0017 TaxID=3103866 RepID=UPI0039C7340D
TQNNLATAYLNRILGERAENLELAIAAYQQALSVYTRTAFPEKWAMTQNNLATAYLNRILGERAENLELAIAAYQQALSVYTRTAFPEKWAMTQNNLATAYLNRILGERAENLELAIAAYQQALSVYTRTAFPQNNAETLLNFGKLYQDEKQFDLAYNTFTDAIVTVESIRGEIFSGDESKRKQAEEWNQLYRRMAEVCLALGKETEAIEYIERSKTRNLVELLTKATSTSQVNLPLISSSICFPEIQNLLDYNTAIIQWYIFNDCFRAFIITQDKDKPVIWHSDQQDLENLVNWIVNYLKLYSEDKKRWQYQLGDQLTQLTQILHFDQIISLIPTNCHKLVLIPHHYLHLFPFHAIPLSTNSSTPEYLIDRFPDGVSYAPSCQLLRFAQLKAQQLASSQLNQLSDLFAIQNPTNDLDFTDIEVETIATNFQPHQILKHSQATKAVLAEQSTNENLCKSQWLHFSCHGYFNFQFPLKSGLQLADAVIYDIPANTYSSRNIKIDENTAIDLDKCLTLEDIFLLNLPNCHLVTLSACETGLIDSTNKSDEYIGLASGFIKAGAANIITTLWAVSDFHTALLMIRFYETLPQNSYNVTLALNKTQQWLRQATQAQIITWIQGIDKIESPQQQQIINLLKQYKPEEQPFKRPEYWAAFCAISPC